MGSSRAAGLDEARALFARSAWAEAYDVFAAADAEEPLALDEIWRSWQRRRGSPAASTKRSARWSGSTRRTSRAGRSRRRRGRRSGRACGSRRSASRPARAGGSPGPSGSSRGRTASSGATCSCPPPSATRRPGTRRPPWLPVRPRPRSASGSATPTCSPSPRTRRGALVAPGRVEEGLAAARRGDGRGDRRRALAGRHRHRLLRRDRRLPAVYALDRAQEWTAALAPVVRARSPQLVAVHRPLPGPPRRDHAAPRRVGGGARGGARGPRRAAPRRATAEAAAAARYQQARDPPAARRARRGRGRVPRRPATRGREPQPGLALLRLAQGRRGGAAAGDPARAGRERPTGCARARCCPAHVEIMLARGRPRRGAPRAPTSCEDARERLGGPTCCAAIAATRAGASRSREGDAGAALAPLRRAFDDLAATSTRRTWPRACACCSARACRALGDEDGARSSSRRRARCSSSSARRRTRRASTQLPAAARARRRPRADRARAPGPAAGSPPARPTGRSPPSSCLSEKTVDRHVSNIFAKLGVSSRAAATAFAYEHDLLVRMGEIYPRRPQARLGASPDDAGRAVAVASASMHTRERRGMTERSTAWSIEQERRAVAELERRALRRHRDRRRAGGPVGRLPPGAARPAAS